MPSDAHSYSKGCWAQLCDPEADVVHRRRTLRRSRCGYSTQTPYLRKSSTLIWLADWPGMSVIKFRTGLLNAIRTGGIFSCVGNPVIRAVKVIPRG